MNKWTIAALTAALTFAAGGLQAADADGRYAAYPPSANKESCGSFNAAVAKGENQSDWRDWNVFNVYTRGFLTAVSWQVVNTYDITGGKGRDAYMGWLEKYCAENPLDSYANANVELVVELYPTRTQTEPK
ncbi:hypothetical protein [Candidatus Marimicrobium litorale]|uniref:HdeA/HdeB family protein n=1 Tax=Candidatus Marimicrobium litorale TaxID=2518991 RepID=A0ABT3T288_9GAMM|nr:hypothetical protein [Candidatus Marimicrobium litorale]MCX2976376.1 hypothetical protein [Candidatus Marimicrobium litorale]